MLLKTLSRTSLTLVILLIPISALAEPPALNKVDAFIEKGLPFFASRVSPKQLRTLPKFRKEQVSYANNEYEPSQRDSHHVFTYDGMSVWIICSPARSSRCMLATVTLTTTNIKMLYDLTIGCSTQMLISTLGNPSAKNGAEWTYHAESNSVSFIIENNQIKEIRWDLYVG